MDKEEPKGKAVQQEMLTCNSCARYAKTSGGCNGMGSIHPDPCEFWLPLDYCFAEGSWLYSYENGILTRIAERKTEDGKKHIKAL